jgi:2-methylcitrate dehydratase PrpD
LPYIFAKTLIDGTITLAAFEPSAYRDLSIRPLMSKIRVRLDDEVNSLYPKTISIKIKATTNTGESIELWPRDPLGHVNKPMKDEHIREKFVQTITPILGTEQTAKIQQRWWNIAEASSSDLTKALSLLDFQSAAHQQS